MATLRSPRSYTVVTPMGTTARRNSKQVIQAREAPNPATTTHVTQDDLMNSYSPNDVSTPADPPTPGPSYTSVIVPHIQPPDSLATPRTPTRHDAPDQSRSGYVTRSGVHQRCQHDMMSEFKGHNNPRDTRENSTHGQAVYPVPCQYLYIYLMFFALKI